MSVPHEIIDLARRIKAEQSAPLLISIGDEQVKTIERGDTIFVSAPDWEVLADVVGMGWPGAPIVYWPEVDLTWVRNAYMAKGTLVVVRKDALTVKRPALTWLSVSYERMRPIPDYSNYWSVTA